VALLAFAAERRAAAALRPATAAVDRYRLLAGPTAATRRTLLRLWIDGTDGRTDGRTPFRYTDRAAYYASRASQSPVLLSCDDDEEALPICPAAAAMKAGGRVTTLPLITSTPDDLSSVEFSASSESFIVKFFTTDAFDGVADSSSAAAAAVVVTLLPVLAAPTPVSMSVIATTSPTTDTAVVDPTSSATVALLLELLSAVVVETVVETVAETVVAAPAAVELTATVVILLLALVAGVVCRCGVFVRLTGGERVP